MNVTAKLGDKRISLVQPFDSLFDGQDTPPADRWLKWSDIGLIDSGWRGPFSLEIEAKKQMLRVKAVTFVEDPAYPESWLRDARLEYWNPTRKQWTFAQYLTSDTAIHSHKLATPVEASLFRLAPSSGKGWPASNLRLAEIVFHGETLAGSEDRRTP